jgi:hypothetical protein
MKPFLLLTLVTLPLTAGPVVSSTFDSSSEGWLVAGDGPDTSVAYLPAGGNPGGAIRRADQTDGYMHFQAPANFLGDMSAYYNGTLSYDLLQTVPFSDPEWFYRELLEGAGLLILNTAGLPPDTANWVHRSVTLNAAAGWIAVPSLDDYIGTPITEAQFQAVLANVTALYITGDLISGADLASLDNITLQAVPEPSAWLLTAAALAGLIRRSRPGQSEDSKSIR